MIKYLLSTLFIFTSLGYSQGYCALRHPQSKINILYPECQNFETIISTIDDQTRLDVEQHLGFPLYFYEIGRHNLYAVKKETDLLGIVHARSEKSKWGLVEIIWSLDLNLNIDDFTFQRCRTSAKNRLLDDSFKKIIRGKNFTEIKAILKNLVNNELYQNLNNDQKILTEILLKSAIKTIALTESSWADEIKKLRLKHLSKKDKIEYKLISSDNDSDANEIKFFKDTDDKHFFI
ncbi:hypothetical protein PQO03_05310 [Lentisphaera profundi]|uniref:Uncharacterized protein n=1 Tax=Lentisphaera profundi TaxID=1658616 RepID=A0ABY7VUD2_9BACT|nr:hypothetical protein [Lentisphaera profundi]WDE97369.1 hypothetical protein PQO03_05310 [Lentisphaera profundi]